MERYRDYTDLMFEDWRLPGGWYALEQRFTANQQQTSYVMDTFLHPDEHIYGYKNFWGEDQPLGRKIFVTIVEKAPRSRAKKRWTVTTGRYTHTDMSTTHFNTLEEAMKFATKEMVLTTKKFDRIHNRNTPMWDFKRIGENDPNFNPID